MWLTGWSCLPSRPKRRQSKDWQSKGNRRFLPIRRYCRRRVVVLALVLTLNPTLTLVLTLTIVLTRTLILTLTPTLTLILAPAAAASIAGEDNVVSVASKSSSSSSLPSSVNSSNVSEDKIAALENQVRQLSSAVEEMRLMIVQLQGRDASVPRQKKGTFSFFGGSAAGV